MIDRIIFRAFKTKGLSVSADASRALSSVLAKENNPEGSLSLILDEIRQRIEDRKITDIVINETVVRDVVAYLTSSDEDIAHESTEVNTHSLKLLYTALFRKMNYKFYYIFL